MYAGGVQSDRERIIVAFHVVRRRCNIDLDVVFVGDRTSAGTGTGVNRHQAAGRRRQAGGKRLVTLVYCIISERYRKRQVRRTGIESQKLADHGSVITRGQGSIVGGIRQHRDRLAADRTQAHIEQQRRHVLRLWPFRSVDTDRQPIIVLNCPQSLRVRNGSTRGQRGGEVDSEGLVRFVRDVASD